MVETFVLSDAMEIEHSSKLQAFHIDHSSSVRIPDLKVCYIEQVRRRKFLVANLVKKVGATQLEQDSVGVIDKSLT